MPIDTDVPVQISEIIDSIPAQSDGHGYIGFIITYPDGRIVNRVLEYDTQTHERVHSKIQRMYQYALKQMNWSIQGNSSRSERSQ